MRKLKIAQIAPPFYSVPPKNYGGTELVVYNLTEELVRRGHDVTLFASGDSQTSGTLQSVFPYALRGSKATSLFSPRADKLHWMHGIPFLYHVSRVFEHPFEFDIIHDHTHYVSVFFAPFTKTPVVSTYHGAFNWAEESPIERRVLKNFPHHPWIAISQRQKELSTLGLHFASVIHHGIDVRLYPFEAHADDYLVWIGRITPQKGIEDAIDAARQAGKTLRIFGIVHDRDKKYFSEKVKPLIDQKTIIFEGAADLEIKVAALRHARALLYPIHWEEPFGLVMVEAMAVGTPVIGYARGALPEIVRDGETGFVVQPVQTFNQVTEKRGVKGIIAAIKKLYSLPNSRYEKMRSLTRKRVEEHFTRQHMAEKYEQVYEKILDEKAWENHSLFSLSK
jgi:glycosyltransferase involved in cell wall biosynthesis